jgi:hypothetical protein
MLWQTLRSMAMTLSIAFDTGQNWQCMPRPDWPESGQFVKTTSIMRS